MPQVALSRDTDFSAIFGVSRGDFLENGGFSCSDTGKTRVSECVVGIEDQWCVAKQGHSPGRPIAPSRDTDFPAILGVSRGDFLEKRRFSRSDTGKTPASECVVGIEDQWCVAGNRRSMVCRGDLGYGAENEEYEESTQSPSRQTITAKSHPKIQPQKSHCKAPIPKSNRKAPSQKLKTPTQKPQLQKSHNRPIVPHFGTSIKYFCHRKERYYCMGWRYWITLCGREERYGI